MVKCYYWATNTIWIHDRNNVTFVFCFGVQDFEVAKSGLQLSRNDFVRSELFPTDSRSNFWMPIRWIWLCCRLKDVVGCLSRDHPDRPKHDRNMAVAVSIIPVLLWDGCTMCCDPLRKGKSRLFLEPHRIRRATLEERGKDDGGLRIWIELRSTSCYRRWQTRSTPH